MGILKTASELNNQTAIVFGEQGSGQAAYIRSQVISLTAPESKVLWVAFTNLEFKEGMTHDEALRVNTWDAALVSKWETFTAEIVEPLATGKLRYDALVLDGLHAASKFCMAKIKPDGRPTQPDWGEMGSTMRGVIVKLRDAVPNLMASVDVVEDDEHNMVIAFNRDLYNQVMPYFTRKVYTYTLPIKDVKTGLTTGVSYEHVDNTILALKMRPAKR